MEALLWDDPASDEGLGSKNTFPKPSILWKIFAVPATRDQDDESVTLRRSEGHFQADFRRMSYWSHWSCVMHEQLEEIELIHIIQSFMEDNEPLTSYRYRMELILNRTHAWGINLSVWCQGRSSGSRCSWW